MLRIIPLVCILFVLDQLSKLIILRWVHDFVIVPHVLALELHFNQGIALSLPLTGMLQIVLIVGVLIAAFFYLKKHFDLKQKPNQWIVAGVFGGALGNLSDRFVHGAVVDFIAVGQFPVFNLADSFIFLAVCGIFYREFVKTV